MGTTLSDLKPPAGAVTKRRRVGRGMGSGLGTTSGRGQKGQGARSGGPKKPGFEGGQMPLQRRLPKRGFKSMSRIAYAPINVGQLCKAFAAGAVIDMAELQTHGLVPKNADRVKLLADGEITHALTVRVHACSVAARDKVVAKGGTVDVLPPTRKASSKAA